MTGTFYGTPKRLLHDKNDEWLGVAVDVAPNNDKVAVSMMYRVIGLCCSCRFSKMHRINIIRYFLLLLC